MQRIKDIIKYVVQPVPLFTLGLFPIILKGTSLINALLLGFAFVVSAFAVSAVNIFASKIFSKRLMPAVCVVTGSVTALSVLYLLNCRFLTCII